MRGQRSAPPSEGIVVAYGYGLRIHVERGHLVVEDGIGRERRSQRFHRASGGVKRLVVIGHTGFVTLDALRWLYDVRAAMVHIDADGRLLTTSAVAGRDVPGLRREQVLAVANETGVQIARELLCAKVQGQASLLGELPGGERARGEIDGALGEIQRARSLPALLVGESQAAAAYWGAWAALPVAVASRGRRDEQGIPDHWRTFGHRHSLLTDGPRMACNPPNAILNYLYALLEAETTLACHRIGLDPGIGIFHSDRRDRASLALDAMEAARPAVDAYVLGLLARRTLAVRDFGETRQGVCRLTAKLAGSLAETTMEWRRHIAPVIERIAHTLAAASGSLAAGEANTPLTRANHRAAWEARAPKHRRRQSRADTLTLPDTCRDCGSELTNRRHRYCEDCRKQRWEQHTSRGRQNAAQVLAALRAEQRDPGHGGRAAELRGSKNAAHQRAVKAWAGERPDPAVFTAEILPGLREIPLPALAATTDLSEHYCSLIRLGKRVPHPRHWEALRRMAATAMP
jgi:CRISPR-associated endonuclease Cas1